ncbi:MAG: TPM domain-containing protein [Microscillaceae bacterium]
MKNNFLTRLWPTKPFLRPAQEKALVQGIQAAEKNTSGEIRVHIEAKLPKEDPFERALELFQELQMHQTRQRNGVLFYLALADHKFAIVADEGINQVAPDGFWDSIWDEMQYAFQEKRFTEGLLKGIAQTGEKLKAHFPYQKEDENELPDTISKS